MKALTIIEQFGGNSGQDFAISCNMTAEELAIVLKHCMTNEVIRIAIFAAAMKFADECNLDLGNAQKMARVNAKQREVQP